MFARILLLLLSPLLLYSQMIDYEIKPSTSSSNTFMKVKILDSKELKFSNSDVSELSAIAYKNNKLYALGDKGFLYHFDIKIQNSKIQNLHLDKLFRLKNKKAKKLKKSKRDSEGIALVGNNILISFEKKPRVTLFSQDGIKIQDKKINKALRDIKNYKSENKALEALAYNEKYGILTAPELPLNGEDKTNHTLYAKKKTWKFKALGSLTSLEFMSKNKVMILQRKFNSFTRHRVITISQLNLKTNEYQILAKFDTKDGWNIDNFEGLTKVSKKQYLMISDDNDSFLQKTLLVLFEVNE